MGLIPAFEQGCCRNSNQRTYEWRAAGVQQLSQYPEQSGAETWEIAPSFTRACWGATIGAESHERRDY
jgi:hypothetical protein